MKKVLPLLLLVILFVAGIWFLPQRKSAPSDVSASFYPLYFFTEQIAGDKLQVSNLTPAGVEPHDFEPSAQDIAKLQHNKLLVLNGAGFEPWFEGIKSDLEKNNVTVISATEGLNLLEGQEEEDHDESEQDTKHLDPHVWLSPLLAKEQVSRILSGLEKVDSVNAIYYKTNATLLLEKLDALDMEFKQGLESCERRSFITSHAAFAYLAQAYNLEQIAISGISPDEEPSTKDLAQVAEFAHTNNVKYIFFETLVSPKLSETIAHEIGAQTLVLDPIEGISDDEIQKGADYFTVMRQNLKNLQTALECKS